MLTVSNIMKYGDKQYERTKRTSRTTRLEMVGAACRLSMDLDRAVSIHPKKTSGLVCATCWR